MDILKTDGVQDTFMIKMKGYIGSVFNNITKLRFSKNIKTDAKQTVHTFSPISPVLLIMKHKFWYFWIP